MTQMNRFVVAETFGVKAPRGLSVEGFTDPMHPQIPVKKPYVFREQLRDVLALLADPAGDGLLLTGPTGAGKTSLLVAALEQSRPGERILVAGFGHVDQDTRFQVFMIQPFALVLGDDGRIELIVFFRTNIGDPVFHRFVRIVT